MSGAFLFVSFGRFFFLGTIMMITFLTHKVVSGRNEANEKREISWKVAKAQTTRRFREFLVDKN